MQDLEITTKFIRSQFKKNNRRSLSALFRHIRNQERTSLIGDFPLLSAVLQEAQVAGVSLTRFKVYWMLKSSEEYNALTKGEKVKWYDALIFSALGVLKLG